MNAIFFFHLSFRTNGNCLTLKMRAISLSYIHCADLWSQCDGYGLMTWRKHLYKFIPITNFVQLNRLICLCYAYNHILASLLAILYHRKKFTEPNFAFSFTRNSFPICYMNHDIFNNKDKNEKRKLNSTWKKRHVLLNCFIVPRQPTIWYTHLMEH